ncbi:MAG TPA: TolC family protein [Vicinamibacteria bacterium]|nr:TolC family protein [Vicinamibacteria bacterium]
MRLRAPIALVLLLAALPSGPLPAQERLRLSLGEALDRAAVHSPAARAASWERRARDADAVAASAAYLPQLAVELGALRTDDPVAVFGTKLRQGRFGQADFALAALNAPAPVTDVSTVLSVEQPVFQPMALSGRRAARAGARAARLGEERTGQVVAFEVLRAYFGARLAADRVGVLDQSLEAARQTLEQVEVLRREGVVTVVDEQLARSRVGELEAALAGARAAATAATDLLLHLLGMEPGLAVVLTDSLSLAAPAVPDSAERADLAALRAGLEAREANLRRARGQWLPSVGAFGSLGWHDGEVGVAGGPRHWTAGVVVRWSPFRGLSDVGLLRRAQAERGAARSELEAAERRARAEVRAAEAEREAARAGFAAAEAALAQAAQAARAARARYAEGAAVITELLAVRAAESGQRLARLQALYHARIADAALTLALGGTPR